MPLKKLTGNFIEVIDALDYSPKYYSAQKSIAAYNKQIEIDLDRTYYASYTTNVALIKQCLGATEHLAGKTHSYTQGNFDGGIFFGDQQYRAMKIMDQNTAPLIAQKNKFKEQQKTSLTPEEYLELKEQIDVLQQQINDMPMPHAQTIRICCTNDNNDIMAVYVSFIRNDSDLNIPLEQRTLDMTVAVIKNPHFAPEEREVIFFAPAAVLDKKAITEGEDIADDQFWPQLSQALESTHLKQLLAPLFNGSSLSLEPFNNLSKRLKSGINIDNRDEKQIYFKRFYQFAHDNLAPDTTLTSYLEDINGRTTKDANFFADEQLDQLLTKMHQTIDTHLDDIDTGLDKNVLKTQNKLNLWIVQLQLHASLCTSSQVFEQQAINLQVERLLAVISGPDIALNRYHDLEFRQIDKEINKAVSRKKMLHERAKPLDALYTGSAFTAFMTGLKSIDFFNEDAFQETLTNFSEQVEAKITELHQSLVQQVHVQVHQLQAISKGANNLPEFIHEALLRKAAIMEEQIKSLKPLELARECADVSINQEIERIFSTIEIGQKSQIMDEARARAQQLPVVEAPKADTRSFFSRNLVGLGVVTTSILLTAGLVLIATGVLAPIGIAFAGLALIATIVAAALTSTLVAGAGIKIVRDEIKRTNNFDLATQLHNNYNNELKQIATEKQTQTEELSADFQQYQEQINQLISSVESQDLEKSIAGESLSEATVEPDSPQQLLQSLDKQLNEGQQQVGLGGGIIVTLPQRYSNEPQPVAENIDEIEHNTSETVNLAPGSH